MPRLWPLVSAALKRFDAQRFVLANGNSEAEAANGQQRIIDKRRLSDGPSRYNFLAQLVGLRVQYAERINMRLHLGQHLAEVSYRFLMTMNVAHKVQALQLRAKLGQFIGCLPVLPIEDRYVQVLVVPRSEEITNQLIVAHVGRVDGLDPLLGIGPLGNRRLPFTLD
jgi:hypothetical protein